MKVSGANRIMFCSPQPKGIWRSWSSPSMVWASRLPVTATYCRAESGTRPTPSDAAGRSCRARDDPAGHHQVLARSRAGTPSGSTIMLLLTASAASLLRAVTLSSWVPMLLGRIVNSALPTSLGATVTVTDESPSRSNQSAGFQVHLDLLLGVEVVVEGDLDRELLAADGRVRQVGLQEEGLEHPERALGDAQTLVGRHGHGAQVPGGDGVGGLDVEGGLAAVVGDGLVPDPRLGEELAHALDVGQVRRLSSSADRRRPAVVVVAAAAVVIGPARIGGPAALSSCRRTSSAAARSPCPWAPSCWRARSGRRP